ncbi:hypothetical protein [Alteribacillus sp. HJP-4]|uniref:hypothetical protein n=1 Tax=Alteribacillus sp. HJP-4 TaxID=2775394 RepID=UPI0035CCEC6F
MKEVIGDTAYSAKENINYATENEIELMIASPSVLEGLRIQGAMAIFTANVKQIVKRMQE